MIGALNPLAFVHRLHERVRGEMPEDAGKVPAATPYSAFDPERCSGRWP